MRNMHGRTVSYHEEYAWENGKLKLMEERQTNNYEDE